MVQMMMCMNYLKNKAAVVFHDFLYDEEGDVNIVSMVVLIGVAVLLAVVFRDGITGLINTLISQIQGKAAEELDLN